MRRLFLAHEEVLADTMSIRFSRIDDATAILRTDACVRTTNYQEFLAVAEQLNLGIVKIVNDAGASFSGPAKTLKFDGELTTAPLNGSLAGPAS
jgi:MscS family membrane protein